MESAIGLRFPCIQVFRGMCAALCREIWARRNETANLGIENQEFPARATLDGELATLSVGTH